jgi:poly-gamma-glutamate synthesis protein (capsule biosynthesis protein)
VVAAAVLVAVLAAGAAGALLSTSQPQLVRGVVVDDRGRAIVGADVETTDASATSDGEGGFQLAGDGGWVTVKADGFLPRTRAAQPGRRVVVRLARDAPGTVSFAFGGDVMFGRRYFDREENGSMKGLLDLTSDAAAHAALLEGVRPALADTDLTVVNLETPLSEDPYLDPRKPRPASFHPTKDYVFASLPVAARALAELGVDVVGLGNNHLFDKLEPGVVETRAALLGAGFEAGRGFFGAGGSIDDAWEPAVRVVEGQRVAVLGCTSITGEEHAISYVAGKAKGGAAACETDRLRAEVRAAAARSDIVVAMIHGGYEYGRDPSPQVRGLSDAAVEAGATMVINHHPHVVGGLRFDRGRLTAWTLGNLLFDQTVWPTFESYLLRVAARDGTVVSAWIEPLRIQEFRPTAVVGDDAGWVARGAFARSEGPWVVDDGSLWLDTVGAAREERVAKRTEGLARLTDSCTPAAGREVLWTGEFENRDLDPMVTAPLWNVHDDNRDRSIVVGAGEDGGRIVRLRRSGVDRSDIVLTPLHRLLVVPGQELTVLVRHRVVSGPSMLRLELGWYNDTRGGSQERSEVRLSSQRSWQLTRLDVKVPDNAVAMQPFIRLPRPEQSLTVADVDDVRVVNWDEPGCEYVREQTVVTRRSLAPLTGPPGIEPLDPVVARPRPPRALPPGPPEAGFVPMSRQPDAGARPRRQGKPTASRGQLRAARRAERGRERVAGRHRETRRARP